jgi:hypothetical protein
MSTSEGVEQNNNFKNVNNSNVNSISGSQLTYANESTPPANNQAVANNSNNSQFTNTPTEEAAAEPVPEAPAAEAPAEPAPEPAAEAAVPEAPAPEAPAEPAPAPEAPAEQTVNARISPEEAPVLDKGKTKKARSTKQREADDGQKGMLEILREMYRKEFSDVPEKFRPKPKVYVARAAWYKPEGPERDKYIQSWILADRNAADARMGVNVRKKRIEEKSDYSNDYVLNSLPSFVSESTGSKEKFNPSTETLKQRVHTAIGKMNSIVDKTEDALMNKIKEPQVRKTAKYLFKQTRKLTKRIGGEIHRQGKIMETLAKKHVHTESKHALHSIEKKAQLNLTAALGRNPPKRMTHRLARLRNSGKGIPVKNFLRGEEKAGRVPKTAKRNWKNTPPSNSTPVNQYDD